MGCISARAYRIGGINATAERVGGIKAHAYQVCDVGKGSYLRVVPTTVQWVDIYSSIEYAIKTNENWQIE